MIPLPLQTLERLQSFARSLRAQKDATTVPTVPNHGCEDGKHLAGEYPGWDRAGAGDGYADTSSSASATAAPVSTTTAAVAPPSSPVGYHGQVLFEDSSIDGGGKGRDEDLSAWHVGKLKFVRHIDDGYRQ